VPIEIFPFSAHIVEEPFLMSVNKYVSAYHLERSQHNLTKSCQTEFLWGYGQFILGIDRPKPSVGWRLIIDDHTPLDFTNSLQPIFGEAHKIAPLPAQHNPSKPMDSVGKEEREAPHCSEIYVVAGVPQNSTYL